MNAERLLKLYDRIADAPDAVDRLRRFVLDLAVRGKLVEQNPEDEPASTLLERIARKKLAAANSATSRRAARIPGTAPNNPPFDIPNDWAWTPATYPAIRISDSGKKIQTKDVLEFGRYPVVDQGKQLIRGFTNESTKLIILDNPLIVFGDHTRETKFIDFDFVVGADGVKLLQPIELDARFYFFLLRWLPLDSRGYGRHFRLLTESYLPLAPLPEQRRIVAKVDELMGLCNQLEKTRGKRETTRDRLTAATLTRLTAPDINEETFRSHAHFALNAFPALTTRPDQIKALRQTILDLAVRGKLVEQDPADTPAANLLEQIAEEKERLIRAGEVQRTRAVPARPSTEEEPFSIPRNWAWSCIAALGIISPRNRAPDGHETSFVPMRMIASKYGINAEHELRVWSEIKSGYTHFAEGDVALAKITPCFENGKSTVFRNLSGGVGAGTTELHVVRPLLVNSDYILLFLKSPYFIETGISKMTGTAGQKRVPKAYFANSPFPLPPLTEQHRIVAKVDELMGLCDRLEESLKQADDKRAQLLDSLLAEALAPANSSQEAA